LALIIRAYFGYEPVVGFFAEVFGLLRITGLGEKNREVSQEVEVSMKIMNY